MRGLLILILCGLSGLSFGQVSLSATVDRTSLPQGEYLKYTVTLNNATGDIKLSNMRGLKVAQHGGTQQSHNIINGKRSSSISETYYLLAEQEGKWTIPAAVAHTSDGVVQSQPIVITVVKAGSQTAANQNPNFFTEISVSKKQLYIGEPLVITCTIFSRYDYIEVDQIDFPSLDGFWTVEVENPNKNWQQKSINGIAYKFYEAQKVVAYPQSHGTMEIGGFDIQARTRRGFFSNWERLGAKSNKLKLEVLALPAGKPDNFIGSFADLSINAQASKQDIKANEALNVEIVFKGKGNLKLLQAPKIDFHPSFETYDPKIKDQINFQGQGEQGSRQFEYVVIPRQQGQYNIPAIQLSYFDYKAEAYKSLDTRSLTLAVAAAAAGAPSYTYDSRSEVQILNQDIRHIKVDEEELEKKHQVFFPSLPYFMLLLLAPLLYLAALWQKRKQHIAEKDPVGKRRKEAVKTANKHLKEAEKALESNDQSDFRNKLFQGVFQYLSFKLNLPSSQLNKAEITKILNGKIEAESLQKLLATLNQIEMSRFAPDSNQGNTALMQQGKELIEELEKKLK